MNIINGHKNTNTQDIGQRSNLELVDRFAEVDIAALEGLALGGSNLGIVLLSFSRRDSTGPSDHPVVNDPKSIKDKEEWAADK